VVINQKEQMKNENTYYFVEKEYEFKENDEEVQKKLKERDNKSNLLQRKILNMQTMEKKWKISMQMITISQD
jgi:hypothetical protein